MAENILIPVRRPLEALEASGRDWERGGDVETKMSMGFVQGAIVNRTSIKCFTFFNYLQFYRWSNCHIAAGD